MTDVLTIVSFSGAAVGLAAMYVGHRAIVAARVQVDIQKERATFWRERTAEARADLTAEIQAHAMTRAEHVALLKAVAPEYIVRRATGELVAGAEVEKDDTPSVTEADRRAAVARREAREWAARAEDARRIRAEGYEPIVVAGSGTEPPHRLDGTAHLDDDE